VDKKVMRETCNAITSKGEKCRLPAGYQTIHKGVGRCKFHDGQNFDEKRATNIKHDSAFIIIDRNTDLIDRYLDKLSLGQSIIEVINILRDCISEIALVEKDDVTVTVTEQGIQIATFDNIPKHDDVIFKEYMKIGNSLNEKFAARTVQLSSQKAINDWSNKFKIENPSLSDVSLEPSKTARDINVEQSESKPNKYQTRCAVIFYLLTFGWIIIFSYCLEHYLNMVPLIIIMYVVVVIILGSWSHKKGYWRFPTKEEREAEREESMRKWGGPIKSAHIIRMERGLRTGLGNRRPYPHGRRTKKY